MHHLVPDARVDEDHQRTADRVQADFDGGLELGPQRGDACRRIRPDEAEIAGQ